MGVRVVPVQGQTWSKEENHRGHLPAPEPCQVAEEPGGNIMHILSDMPGSAGRARGHQAAQTLGCTRTQVLVQDCPSKVHVSFGRLPRGRRYRAHALGSRADPRG
eukprot:9093919-Lingulodinium_polyedra.AAC.1